MAEELSMDQAFIKRLDAVIESHLEDEQFGVEELAKELGLSRSQLHRKLNGLTGKSSSQYIREYRLEKSMEMLQNNVATASEIAYRVGFGSPTYFNSSFNKYYGYPPGEVKFRKTSNSEEQNGDNSLNELFETVTIKRRLYDLRTYIIGALVLVLVVVLGYYNYANSGATIDDESKESVAVNEHSIAVLPFKNMSGSPDNEAFCDGMTTAIISRLSKIKDIEKVISQTSVMTYKNKQKTMPEIAEELSVSYILESGFQKSEDNIKINVQLIEGASDKLVWSEEYEGNFDSIFRIQARVAEMVAKQLDVDITEEEQKNIQQAMTDNLYAYESYLQGALLCQINSANNYIASRKYFEKAIELDSTFAEAYSSLGWTYSMMGTWFGTMPKSEADSLAAPYFKKALHFDPNNLNLLNNLAQNEFFNWNFKDADSMFNILRNRAGDNFYSDFLNLTLGRYEQLTKRGNFILKKNPNSGLYFPILYGYYHEGEIDTVNHIMINSIRSDPNSEPNYDHFGNLFLATGDFEMAADLLETGLQISDKRHASMVIHLALAVHYLGYEDRSRKLLNEIIDRAEKGEPNTNVFVAHYYARLGNYDEAFKWLDIAYKKHEVDLIWLKADPNLKLLEDDPRYQKLVKKMGFLEI